MRRTLLVATAALPLGCGHAAAPPAPPPSPMARATPAPAASTTAETVPAWPEALTEPMKGRGEPHAQPIALPRDARGRDRWLVFVGDADDAIGAWRVSRGDGDTQLDPVERWPTGVRVVGGIVQDGVVYVLLESLAVLDQPAGLRGVWIDAGLHASPFEATPMALGDVHDATELAARVAHPPPAGAAERSSVALLATLRAASASTAMLARTLAAEGADVDVAWQSTFVQRVGRLDGEGSAASPLADRVLGIVRAAVTTQACGADACEAWTDSGHAVVRFVVQAGRWVVRSVIEDSPVTRKPAVGPSHDTEAASDGDAASSILHARVRDVKQLLGSAPLTSTGGTIGVAVTDMAADVPVIVVREGAAARIFVLDAGTVRTEASEARWEAAFADVDGDGRTDVVLRMNGKRTDGGPLLWTQTYLAPPPSVQVTSLDADLASSLATMDAVDVRGAAHVAAALPARGVSRDEACRLLTAASSPAGFRRVASPDARVLLFDEPGLPTWRPKVVSASKVAADDVRGLGAHCAELVCSATRPYCVFSSGADSEHAWFGWRDGQLAIVGVADYQGE